MRRPVLSAALLIAFGLATAAAQDGGSSSQPEASKAPPASSQQQQGEQAVGSKSGQNGKEEPGSHAPSDPQTKVDPVFVNGALNVPGAPVDGQTVPAKFSQRNDAIDKLPVMAMPLGLSDQQKGAIVAAVRAAKLPVEATKAKPADELADSVTVHELSSMAGDPDTAKLRYVQAEGRILLIDPPNRIVVGEIAN